MVDAIVPESIKLSAPLALPAAINEEEALARIGAIARGNRVFRSFIGQGYYGTHVPKVILRNILENPAWYTAYTPYQAEISQGRMEALINFQTMVADLSGMEIANASLLDEATAAAEAMTLARRSARTRAKSSSSPLIAIRRRSRVVRTRRAARHRGQGRLRAGPDERRRLLRRACPVSVDDQADPRHAAVSSSAHARGALVAVATDLLALTLLAAPGEWGADIVVGNSQRFGVPFGFGGPHAGFLACKDAFKRSMPGRLVGVSVDSQGKPAYRLTLQTREQHIRREKATSNICTAQVLLAVMASMYAVYTDPKARRASRGRCTGSPASSPRVASGRLAGQQHLLRHADGRWRRRGEGPRRGTRGRLNLRCSVPRFRRTRRAGGRHRARRNRDPR
jgi:glycine dehydrogenase